jgi:hypothetical protein
LLPGCGGDGPRDQARVATVTSHSTGTVHVQPRPKPQRRQPPAGDLCRSQLGSFVGSMDGLRRRLAVGVTYDQYVAEVRAIGSTYRKISSDALEIGCLTAVGTPGEKAFNRYIQSANEWGDCISRPGCETARIEPALQRRWRIADRLLSEAEDGLEAVSR